MKATAEELHFHRRMLDPGDPTAFAAFAEWIYEDLVRKTRARAHPDADPALIEEAVGSALLEYGDAPHRYNPHASSLLYYLSLAAYRDYLNAAAKERRRAMLPFAPEGGSDRDIVDDRQDLHRLLQRLDIEPLLQTIDAAFSDPTDRQVVALLLENERSYQAYAQVLGITHLPDQERDAEVKRVKDRIAKRLRRIGSKLHD